MSILETIHRIINGIRAGADTRDEAAALLAERLGGLLAELAQKETVDALTDLGQEYGIGFVVDNGRVSRVVFD